MTDRELDARIAAQHTVINTVDAANANIAACALPRPDDVRRLIALQGAVGDLSANLSHGLPDDVTEEWKLIGAIAQAALEAGLVEESRRTANGYYCTPCGEHHEFGDICSYWDLDRDEAE